MILRKLDRTNSEELKKAGCTYLKMLSAGTYNNKPFVLYEPSGSSDTSVSTRIDNIRLNSGKDVYICI